MKWVKSKLMVVVPHCCTESPTLIFCETEKKKKKKKIRVHLGEVHVNCLTKTIYLTKKKQKQDKQTSKQKARQTG